MSGVAALSVTEPEIPAPIAALIERDFPADEPGIYVPLGGQRGGYFDCMAIDFADGRARHYSVNLTDHSELTDWAPNA